MANTNTPPTTLPMEIFLKTLAPFPPSTKTPVFPRLFGCKRIVFFPFGTPQYTSSTDSNINQFFCYLRIRNYRHLCLKTLHNSINDCFYKVHNFWLSKKIEILSYPVSCHVKRLLHLRLYVGKERESFKKAHCITNLSIMIQPNCSIQFQKDKGQDILRYKSWGHVGTICRISKWFQLIVY